MLLEQTVIMLPGVLPQNGAGAGRILFLLCRGRWRVGGQLARATQLQRQSQGKDGVSGPGLVFQVQGSMSLVHLTPGRGHV